MTNFAATRLLAAAAVVLGHSFVLTGATPPALLGTPVHVLAVRVFFVISGYLVFSSWRRDPHMPRFLMRRALRVLPGLFAVVLLSVFVVGPLVTRLPFATFLRDPATADYLWNLVLSPRFALPGVFDDGRAFTAVNGSLWSLPVEVGMYLLLPLYAGTRVLVRVVLPVAGLAAVAGAVAFTVLWPDQVQPVLYGTSIPFSLRFAADFVLGAGIAAWRLERWLNLQAALLLGIAAQACSGAPVLLALLSAAALPYGVLAFCLAAPALFGGWGRRADLSYGVYLWGGPVQQVVLSVIGAQAGPGLHLLASAPFVLGLAWASWRLVERPALRFKPPSAATATGVEFDRRVASRARG